MEYVLSGSQMKACDCSIINGDIHKSLALIDCAADACIKNLMNSDFDLSHCLVVCGKGNNGADGFAIAQKLHRLNCNVSVLVSDKLSKFSPEASILYRQLDIPVTDYKDFSDNDSIDKYSTIIDAIFGIGLSRDVEGVYYDIIRMINESEAKVLSVDIPSGISSDNGEVMKAAVNANVTVTFACYKTGQLIYPGKQYCGKLILEDIGIPLINDSLDDYLVTDIFEDCDLLPLRKPDGNKGTFGKVLVIAGSSEIFGAAYLCGMAAYKAGCGMVHILTEKHNADAIKIMLPEALLHFYDENNSEDTVKQVSELVDICDVICVGPGISVNTCSEKIIDKLSEIDKTMVLDADALNIISKNKWLSRFRRGNCIITPHIMEMSRLTGISCGKIKSDSVNIAKQFVEENNVVLVLKDAVTLVSSPYNNTYVNRTGNCAMSKAGSGDVLAGIIAGLLAQKCELYKSACLGVYIHGLIGDRKIHETGQYSLMARNLIDGIEELLNEQ